MRLVESPRPPPPCYALIFSLADQVHTLIPMAHQEVIISVGFIYSVGGCCMIEALGRQWHGCTSGVLCPVLTVSMVQATAPCTQG